jgi:hypothetical protein
VALHFLVAEIAAAAGSMGGDKGIIGGEDIDDGLGRRLGCLQRLSLLFEQLEHAGDAFNQG